MAKPRRRSGGKNQIRLNYTPRPWQAECHLNRQRFTVLAVHRRAGKTVMSIMELLDKAMQCTLELGTFVYLAPLLKQAQNIAWAKLKNIIKPLYETGAVEIREGDLELVFRHNGAKIRLFGANNPDEIRGMGLDGCVIDEVAQIDPEVWEEIVQPTLSDRLGWALFIGTPKGINLFSELFFLAQETPDWHAASYTVYDTHALDENEVIRLKATMTDNAFAREYLCDFMAASQEQVMSLTDIEEAAHRHYKEQDYMRSPRILGVDPARFGDDRSVITRRQGLVAFEPVVLHGVDNMALAARVAFEIEDWKPDAVFIDAGAGAGVIDRLRQMGHSVIEVPFGGKAIKEKQFVDRRCEMWFAMADWIASGGAIPDRRTLKQELATPTYWFEHDRKRLESKDQIKKRLASRASPDEADSLCLCFAAPVADRDPHEDTRRQLEVHQPRARYNPFSAEAIARRRVGRWADRWADR